MILATICMRGGSKGVPGKNSKTLLGKPLMHYTIKCAQQSNYIEDIVISSDSKELLNKAKHYIPERKLYSRKPELATDGASKWDVFKDIVTTYEAKNNVKVTYLVDLDVTVPRRLPTHIDACIELIKKWDDTHVVITGYEPERNPYFNMMEVSNNGLATIVKQSQQPIVCRQDAPKVYSLSPAVYAIKRDALFNFNHWSKANCRIHPIPRPLAIDIDTELDFKLVEFLMKQENE